MNRARTSQILPLILLVSAAVWAAHAADQSSGAAARTDSGAYALTFHVNTPSTVPDGATITCKATITPKLSAFENLTRKATPVVSSPGLATVVGSSANCTVQVPFAIAVSNPRNGAVLSYELDAFTSAGPAFVRTQQGIAFAYPQSGATASPSLNVNF